MHVRLTIAALLLKTWLSLIGGDSSSAERVFVDVSMLGRVPKNREVRRAGAMMDAYRIDSWPTVAVDGRFLTSPSQANEGVKVAQTEAQQQESALRVLDYLVAKAKSEKK